MEVEYPKTKVIYGEDALEWLSNVSGDQKIGIVTTRSLLQSKLLKRVLKFVKKADVIQGPRQHTPKEDKDKLSQIVKDYDVVIAVGGGSIIDGVKLSQPKYFIAIPTTFSGAEHTSSGGYTVEGLKVSERGKEADVVILDPYATLETPLWLLYASGVRAIDHAVEALYSRYSTPFSDSLAVEGYKKLIDCLRKIESMESRLECQIGSWLSSLAMRYSRTGLSHIFGYVYGPRFNIPHGVTSCISLPYAIKLNYEVSREKLKLIEEGGKPLYEYIDDFLKELNLKRRLSEFASIDEVIKYVDVLVDLTNKSGNPTRIDHKTAVDFLKEVY